MEKILENYENFQFKEVDQYLAEKNIDIQETDNNITLLEKIVLYYYTMKTCDMPNHEEFRLLFKKTQNYLNEINKKNAEFKRRIQLELFFK